jgi:OOP family OmpA-OmpF porin
MRGTKGISSRLFLALGAAAVSVWVGGCGPTDTPSPQQPLPPVGEPAAGGASASSDMAGAEGSGGGAAAAPGEAAAPAREKTTKFDFIHSELMLPDVVVYQTGGDALKPESDAPLWVVVDFLDARSDVTKLRVEVHTDSSGDKAANQALSEKRALAVVRWLVGHGVDCKRLLAVGFGDTKPIAENATPEGKARNRRTSFVAAELRGKPIGGMPVDGGGKIAGDACL